MKIEYNGNYTKIINAVQVANNLLNNNEFYRLISEHSEFDLANVSPNILSKLIFNSKLVFIVLTFTPSFFQSITGRYSKTYAYTNTNNPKKLFLNTKKLNRSSESISASVIHESIHAIDNTEIKFKFGHGDNSSIGKNNTAPYWIGNLAYRILTQNPNAPELTFNDIYRISNNDTI